MWIVYVIILDCIILAKTYVFSYNMMCKCKVVPIYTICRPIHFVLKQKPIRNLNYMNDIGIQNMYVGIQKKNDLPCTFLIYSVDARL